MAVNTHVVCRTCGETLPQPEPAWKAYCDEVCYNLSALAPAPTMPRRKQRQRKVKPEIAEVHKKRQLSLLDYQPEREQPAQPKKRQGKRQQ